MATDLDFNVAASSKMLEAIKLGRLREQLAKMGTRNTVLQVIHKDSTWPTPAELEWKYGGADKRKPKLEIGTKLFAVVAPDIGLIAYVPTDCLNIYDLLSLEADPKNFRTIVQNYGYTSAIALKYCEEILDGSSYTKGLVERGVLQRSKKPASTKSVQRRSETAVPDPSKIARSELTELVSSRSTKPTRSLQSDNHYGDAYEFISFDETDDGGTRGPF